MTTLRVDVSGAVAFVTLDRPEVLNAYSIAMRDELWQTFSDLARLPDLRALVVQGEDKAFCAGADLTEFGTAPSPFEARAIRFSRDVWAALRRFPVPTIAAIHGYVIGTGLELALHCSVRIAAASTVLIMPEARLGLLPAAGGTQTLPRAGTSAHVARLLYLGEHLTAAEALEGGLVEEVVSDEDLRSRAAEVADEVAERPRAWGEGVVRLLRLQDELGLRDAIEAERALSLGTGTL